MKPRRSFVLALALSVTGGAGFALGRIAVVPPTTPASALEVPQEHPLAKSLRERYGPNRNSADLEEWIIRDFFQDERGGVFVDVGANHHRVRSNTYYLETSLGWSGVAIEPLTQFVDGYKQFRPRTTFVPLFVSDISNQNVVLYVPVDDGYHRVASQDRAFTESFGIPAEATTVRTTTLDDVLDRLNVRKVDFMSMDIELAEPQALAGFSVERFSPRLVGIEAHEGVQEQILEYFSRHGYVLIGKYLEIDGENYWFAPTGAVKDDPPLVH